ncbi:TolC family protein [Alkalimarinus alittae]|uniref:TolC family protein n=1 Tax=Alkalimarinus alittae TaxID=2961619 RepID=A0ABY6N5C7_9ALTE|nr:TolC family protein [Alkalimarinus alittae]UZE97240.1 TolC family protein [Alkalimarinus alittae]
MKALLSKRFFTETITRSWRFNAPIFCLFLGGCAVSPQLATQDEVRDRVASDTTQMFENQEAINGPITLDEALARALKYNLDFRLKNMESALALGLNELSKFDMLPRVLASAGYSQRNNDSGGSSYGIEDGLESLRPSSSQEKSYHTESIEFSWNSLDFGVSYYRARQQADQYLIAEERRRKVVQGLFQDVRASYWRALGAQRLEQQVSATIQRIDRAIDQSTEAEAQQIIAPVTALNYQRALLDAAYMLNKRRQDLAYAKSELAALMNVPSGVTFSLADTQEHTLPAAPNNINQLEEMALLQRPELREEDFRKRITADETRKQILSMFPAISLNYGLFKDSNKYLYNNEWTQGGVSLSWNLMKLASIPSLNDSREEQEKTDTARRMALSMAILTQVRISIERYRLAAGEFNLADKAADVDHRLSQYARDALSSKMDSELEVIRTEAKALLGDYQRANAYANSQIAFGRLYNTLGFDPLPYEGGDLDLAQLTALISEHRTQLQTNSFSLKSQLFGQQANVSIRVQGIDDPILKNSMTEQLVTMLERNDISVDQAAGIPLTFSLSRNNANGLQKALWLVKMDNKDDSNSVEYETTLPQNARASTYEASLLAAASASLSSTRNWLSQPLHNAQPSAQSVEM